MTPTLALVLAALVLTLPEAPPPPAVPKAAAAGADVARLREHLQRLVDTRAERLGGPHFAEKDRRLGVLHAMLRTAATQPQIPIPAFVWQADTLEALWGRSSAVFTVQLMRRVAEQRPSGKRADAATCRIVCRALISAAATDTRIGQAQRGWPMPEGSAKAIEVAAEAVIPECLKVCETHQVPNLECVAKVERQGELMGCWAPKPPPAPKK